MNTLIHLVSFKTVSIFQKKNSFYGNEINKGLIANEEDKKQFNIFYSFLTFICIGVVIVVVIAVIHLKFEWYFKDWLT